MTLTLTSDLVSGNLHRVWCISPIFCEVGIPNLVFGCILGGGVLSSFLGHSDLDL